MTTTTTTTTDRSVSDARPYRTVSGLHTQYDLISELQQAVRHNPATLAKLPHELSTTAQRVKGVADVGQLAAVPVVPAADGRIHTFDDVLEHRSSERFYLDAPLPLGDMARVVRAAHNFDAATWTADADAGVELDFLLATRNVTGTQPGLYRLDGDHFSPIAPLPEQGAEDLVLQIEFAYSPAILIAIAPFADLLARWGDHGERLANTRAAAAISAALFEAASLGIAGSPFAGFLTSGLRQLITADGYVNAQMFAASFGYSAE